MTHLPKLIAFASVLLLSASCEQLEDLFDKKGEPTNPNIVNGVDTTQISASYDFAPHYLEVLGSRMHYVDEPGHGDETFVLLHGQPTWSYLWRNVIPHLKARGRVIAPDLIGMGKSNQPDIDYTLAEHVEYVNGFINQLEVDNIILVIHDWGSVLGFNYANTFPDKIKGIVFMEAVVAPAPADQIPPLLAPTLAVSFSGEEGDTTQGTGWRFNAIDNRFINEVLPQLTLRPLEEPVMNAYRAPYPTVASRKVVWQWPRQVPIIGQGPEENIALVQDYFENYLTQSEVPKLFLYATPGMIGNAETAAFSETIMPNLTSASIGSGIHFVQEDEPHRIGIEINQWVDNTF